MSYAELLKKYIESSGKTLEEISEECEEMGIKIHSTYISKLRLGKRPAPSEDISRALAVATGGDPAKLIWIGMVDKNKPFFKDVLLSADDKLINKAMEISQKYPGFFYSSDDKKEEIENKDPIVMEFWQELGRLVKIAKEGEPSNDEATTLLPIVGRIACGNGQLAYQDIEGYEATPKEWLNGGEYFYLRAKGNSMTGARINDGDLLLIRKQPAVEEGEIAAVIINDEAMLKRVYFRDGKLILQSENPNFPPEIVTEGDVTIIGKLKKLIVNM